jgi:DNA-binding LytR/AlgR family response regulator
MITVCFVEDDTSLQENLSRLIGLQPDMQLAGAYADAETALANVDWQNTDVLRSDIELAEMSGVELIREAL